MSATTEHVVGVLHPGAMGVTVASSCLAPTLWCPSGRSSATTERAAAAGLTSVDSLSDLVERSTLIVSVCPPGVALDVAEQVTKIGFDGIYVDANAVAPLTAREIASRFERFVDGGIVGPPAHAPGTTRLYLSGDEAASVAALWEGSLVEPRVVDGGPGAASALKMAYATWTKVSSALLLSVRALARAEGVEAALLDEWAISQPGAAERSERSARGTAPKAWRFVGEMRQIAATYEVNDLPPGFARAAAEIYGRMAGSDELDDADLDAVLTAIMTS